MPAASQDYEFQRLHGMGEALYEALLAELPAADLPRLCAGRRPSRSARLSGAAAAGERRQLLVRVGRRRSGGADRRRSCGGRRAGSAMPAHARHPHIPLPRDLFAPERQEFGRRRIRRQRGARRAARPRSRAAPQAADAAPLIDGVARRRARARDVLSPIDGDSDRHGAAKATQRSSPPRWPRRRPALPAWDATPVARARARRSSAPAI